MKHSVEYGPAFAWLRVALEPGETIEAEAGAMVTRTPELEMTTRLNAGKGAGFFAKVLALFAALARKLFGGETMFVNDFHGSQGGEVVLAPKLSGHIEHRRLDGRGLLVQAGSYLASGPGLTTKLRWGGLRGLLGGEGLFFLHCTGAGDLFINSYGGVLAIDVDGEYIVDTGHIVAFDDTLDFEIKSAGQGIKALFLSGEGLVCRFRGRGRLYIQSRNVSGLVGWISPYLR
ncbi:MAG: TIGR00266 family protein [bacterium]|nr:TIGR00266 family protein [Myxococcales bacterium]MCB9551385.1 TIGR00266 family protein [Myxococcales bacterium]